MTGQSENETHLLAVCDNVSSFICKFERTALIPISCKQRVLYFESGLLYSTSRGSWSFIHSHEEGGGRHRSSAVRVRGKEAACISETDKVVFPNTRTKTGVDFSFDLDLKEPMPVQEECVRVVLMSD